MIIIQTPLQLAMELDVDDVDLPIYVSSFLKLVIPCYIYEMNVKDGAIRTNLSNEVALSNFPQFSYDRGHVWPDVRQNIFLYHTMSTCNGSKFFGRKF